MTSPGRLARLRTLRQQRKAPPGPEDGGEQYGKSIRVPNYIGSREDLRRALIDLNRRGQLEVIKR